VSRPLKLLHFATSHEIVLGWLTQAFELYAVFSPLQSKLSVITAVRHLLNADADADVDGSDNTDDAAGEQAAPLGQEGRGAIVHPDGSNLLTPAARPLIDS
jgi:hypothetical protein